MVEIIVNNESLDLFQGETIALTMSVNEMGKLGKRQGDYSNSFKIPDTDKNLSVLGYVDSLNFNSSNVKYEAVLKQNGSTFREGFISIEKYDTGKRAISISFYSGNVSWFDLIKDKVLRDVDLTEFNHVFNAGNVIASFNNTEGYIYPLINNGLLSFENSFDTNIYSWMPSTFVHSIMRNMFRDIGYKLTGSFIDSDIYKRLILPYSIKGFNFFNYSDVAVRLVEARNDLSSLQTWVAPAAGTEIRLDMPIIVSGNEAGLYNTSNDSYSPDWGGWAEIAINIDASFSDPNILPNLDLVIKENGVDKVVRPFVSVLGRPQPHVMFNDTTYDTTGSMVLDFYIRYDAAAPVTVDTITIESAIFAVTDTYTILEDSEIKLNGTLPDIKQPELLSTLFNQFGLIAQENATTKEISINYFRDLKANIPNAVDWSDKVDLSDMPNIDFQSIKKGYGRKNHFRYKHNGDDPEAEFYKEVAGTGFGDGFFELDGDLKPSEDVFESAFCPTLNVNSFRNETTLLGGLLPYVPRYSDTTIDINDPDVEPDARILILQGNTAIANMLPTQNIFITYSNGAFTNAINTAPCCYFDRRLNGTILDNKRDSLLFSRDLGNNTSDALLDTYYSDYIEILQNPKLLKLKIDLNPIDIHNIDFFTPVYLSQYNAYFYINKIGEYRAGNETTLVELIKIS